MRDCVATGVSAARRAIQASCSQPHVRTYNTLESHSGICRPEARQSACVTYHWHRFLRTRRKPGLLPRQSRRHMLRSDCPVCEAFGWPIARWRTLLRTGCIVPNPNPKHSRRYTIHSGCPVVSWRSPRGFLRGLGTQLPIRMRAMVNQRSVLARSISPRWRHICRCGPVAVARGSHAARRAWL